MWSSDKYKPELHKENIEQMMRTYHGKMTAFEILSACIAHVKQPKTERASGDACCGGGGSLYEISDDVSGFLDLMEAKKIISAIEHRDIERVPQDHIRRDLIALYYYLNERKAKDCGVTEKHVPSTCMSTVFDLR